MIDIKKPVSPSAEDGSSPVGSAVVECSGGDVPAKVEISNISAQANDFFGDSVRIVLTGEVEGSQVTLGYMNVDVRNGYSYVDIYKVEDKYQGNALSQRLFASLIEKAGPSNSRIIEGKPAYSNVSALRETGDITKTPWARILDKLGYETEYDSLTNTMTSTRKKNG